MMHKIVPQVLIVVGLASLIYLLGITGACENDSMTLSQYIPRGFVSVAVFGICATITNRI